MKITIQKTAQDLAAPNMSPEEIESRALIALVDTFALRMKNRLLNHLVNGKSGWDDPSVVSDETLVQYLDKNVKEVDYIDAANIMAMLWNRQE